MIRFLAIQNLAVIDRLELELQDGLNVLTGETGAGKSVLVEAVGLLLGARAASTLVRTGAPAATVQAVFDAPDGREVIVRREVSSQGRSRAFADDELVSSAGLRAVTAALVDLHGQNDHQVLRDQASHLEMLDAFGNLAATLERVSQAFDAWRRLRDELGATELGERERAERIDLATFQLGEIDRAAPRAGEDEDLAGQLRVLRNAERLHRCSVAASEALYEGEAAALPALARVWKHVADLASIDPAFGPYLQARDGIKPQLEDLAYFLRSYAAGIESAPDRLQAVADRAALLDRLKRKHGGTMEALLTRQVALREELDRLRSSEHRAHGLREEVGMARAAFLEEAEKLSHHRLAAGARLARELERELAQLAMERTRCDVRFDRAPEGEWSGRGIDRAELLISPNPGEELRPLAAIASGGELSRIMLALKTLAGTDTPGKTLVFDEVDAGIGGRVAEVVGRRLRRLGTRFQVLCITHLPQIAAVGEHHFRVEKSVRGGRTTTTVTRLTHQERVEEIARMMGGAAVTDRIRAGAREMLERRGESEIRSKGESETSGRAKAKGRRLG
jgi:DNA repair protein RecN (Recombination protein N)